MYQIRNTPEDVGGEGANGNIGFGTPVDLNPFYQSQQVAIQRKQLEQHEEDKFQAGIDAAMKNAGAGAWEIDQPRIADKQAELEQWTYQNIDKLRSRNPTERTRAKLQFSSMANGIATEAQQSKRQRLEWEKRLEMAQKDPNADATDIQNLYSIGTAPREKMDALPTIGKKFNWAEAVSKTINSNTKQRETDIANNRVALHTGADVHADINSILYDVQAQKSIARDLEGTPEGILNKMTTYEGRDASGNMIKGKTLTHNPALEQSQPETYHYVDAKERLHDFAAAVYGNSLDYRSETPKKQSKSTANASYSQQERAPLIQAIRKPDGTVSVSASGGAELPPISYNGVSVSPKSIRFNKSKDGTKAQVSIDADRQKTQTYQKEYSQYLKDKAKYDEISKMMAGASEKNQEPLSAMRGTEPQPPTKTENKWVDLSDKAEGESLLNALTYGKYNGNIDDLINNNLNDIGGVKVTWFKGEQGAKQTKDWNTTYTIKTQ